MRTKGRVAVTRLSSVGRGLLCRRRQKWLKVHSGGRDRRHSNLDESIPLVQQK
jgi:hypothetical protein